MTHPTGTPRRTTRKPTTRSPAVWSQEHGGDGVTSISGGSEPSLPARSARHLARQAMPTRGRLGAIVIDQEVRTRYDGAEPFPGSVGVTPVTQRRVQVIVTALIVIVPFAGLAVAVAMLWGHGIGLTDVLLAVGFYLITGFGVTVGFHRLLTHRSFTACPGDPHSPYRYGTGAVSQLPGLFDAHMGWLFRDDPTPADRYAPDLLADPAINPVARAFPVLS